LRALDDRDVLADRQRHRHRSTSRAAGSASVRRSVPSSCRRHEKVITRAGAGVRGPAPPGLLRRGLAYSPNRIASHSPISSTPAMAPHDGDARHG
ncbi:MAG TPA: hypothetical protein VF516_02790, partial [Kofleriaceae bacterium]